MRWLSFRIGLGLTQRSHEQTARPCGSSIDDRTARRPGRDLTPEAPEHGPSPRGLSRVDPLRQYDIASIPSMERLTWILCPKQTHTHEDQAGTEQTQADPVHLCARINISFLGSDVYVVAALTWPSFSRFDLVRPMSMLCLGGW
jgi:hypothetical protein